jgi:hypothetical protein
LKACITRCFEMVNGFVSLKISSSYELNFNFDRLTQPLCSSRITSLHRSYGLIRPSIVLHRYSHT